MTGDRIIELDKISVYQHENLILANVTLLISKGEFLYLIGKTGSGKSSLLKPFTQSCLFRQAPQWLPGLT